MVTRTAHARVQTTGEHTLQRAGLYNESLASLGGQHKPVSLGPLDQLVAPIVPVAVVFVYRSLKDTSLQAVQAPRLQQAAELLLDYYPHLTGRLEFDPDDGAAQISNLDGGAKFFTAECDSHLCAFEQPDLSPRILLQDLPGAGNDLLASFEPDLDAVCRGPILAIKHTRFTCGAVALGIRILHKVTDADGFFQFARDLAKVYRHLSQTDRVGLGAAGSAPLLDPIPQVKSFLADLRHKMTPQEREQYLTYQPRDFDVAGSAQSLTAEQAVPTPRAQEQTQASPLNAGIVSSPVTGRVLRFTREELINIKTAATNTDTDTEPSWVSTFEALSAHLFQRVFCARVELVDDPAKLTPGFLASANWRAADKFDLPQPYFPNAIVLPIITLDQRTLTNSPLPKVAGILHNLLRSYSPDEMIKAQHWIAAQPDKGAIRHKFVYSPGTFLVSQWSKFEFYSQLGFDCDENGHPVRPALVAPPFTPISLVDGLAYYVETEQHSQGSVPESLDVYLALLDPLWAILEKDPLFRKA